MIIFAKKILSLIMKYKIEQQNKPTLPSHGKYMAKAVHQNTIDTRQLIDELARRSRSGMDESIIKPVLIGLSEIIKDHLRNGDRVKLDEFGLMKLEISSEKVDKPEDFKPKKHIKGVKLHFLPESIEGKQPLYDDIKFEKVK